MSSLSSFLLLVLLVVLSSPSSTLAKVVLGYYPSWATYDRNFQVANIKAQYLTHINYAFANIQGGKCVLGDSYADVEKLFPGDTSGQAIKGNFNQLIKLKKSYPNLKTLISVGGWSWSKEFSNVALTDSSRLTFVTSCIQFMQKYSFDGIDIDWEYPVEGGLAGNVYRPEDGKNHALLMKLFRTELDKTGKKYLLTIAAPAGPTIYRHLVFSELGKYLDWINLMTYDYAGSWSAYTGHHTGIFANTTDPIRSSGLYADKALKDFAAGGVPKAKLIIGAAFYGRGFKQVTNANKGLFQKFSGVPPGTWETGLFDYDDIKNNYIAKGYSQYYDQQAQAAWIFNPSTRIMISYDSTKTVTDKALYSNKNGHGGVFFWELSGDRNAELLKAIYNNVASDDE